MPQFSRKYILLLLISWIFAHFSVAHEGVRFIENKGQWHEQVIFKASIPGGDFYVLKNKLKYVFYEKGYHDHGGMFENHGSALREDVSLKNEKLVHAIDLEFLGANPSSKAMGNHANSGLLNYFKGSDKENWASGVRSFSELKIADLYEGIDFVLYASAGGIKYDFIVAPEADPDQIKMKYEGQNELKIHEGKIVVGTTHGYFFENAPVSFSVKKQQKSVVSTAFILQENVVGFQFPKGYDTKSQLIIDPELIFSTFSGSSADNWGFTATYSHDGSLYSGGIVLDVGFPTTTGVFQPDHIGDWDVGILKYDSTGTDLLWATYLGGNFSETPQSIIENSQGQLVIYGTTSSPDFPMVDHGFQKVFLGGDPIYDTTNTIRLVGGLPFENGSDIFLAVLGKEGQSLNGATFIGGTENDGIMEKFQPLTKNYGDQFRGEVNLDEQDNIYVASNTSSPDFMLKEPIQSKYGGSTNDGVVMKFNKDLSDLSWSTFVGGSGIDALFSIKVDGEGNVLAAGGSTSIDFPVTTDTYKTSKPNPADIDGVVVKIKPDGSQLLKSTYIGTDAYDQVYFLELDGENNVYLLGQTQGNYSVTDGVYANANSGQFIHKLGADLDTTYFSTVVGSGTGSPEFSPTAFLVNECGNIFISGWGGVLNHPSTGYIGGSTFGLPITENAFQDETDGTDFYLMVLLEDAKQLLYATYFGQINGRGEHVDGGTSRFDKRGIVYQSVCGGCGGSSGFPTWPPDVWSSTNNSSNCNNAAFKFDLASLLAKFDTDTENFTNRGIREGCYPLSLVFLNESLGGEDFLWDFGKGSTTDQEDSIAVTYDTPGQYPVVLTATDINTCVRESKAYGMITVHDYSFEVMPDDSICYGEEIELWAKGGVGYDWQPATSLQNPMTANPVATPDTTTIYSVKMEDQHGCKGEDSLKISVVPQIITDFSYIKESDCHESPVIKFTNKSTKASTFYWDFGDGNTSVDSEPIYQYQPLDTLRTFNVTLTAGEAFCTQAHSESISTVTPFVPNFISPNSDRKNDSFQIITDDAVDIHVYNRWGKEVFSADDYQNDWQANDLASGVYFYEIRLGDGETRCNGWVQVMR